jgi:flagellar biogenesis protein FliO
MTFDIKKIIILASVILLVFLAVAVWGVFKMKSSLNNQGNTLREGKIQGEKVLSLTGEVVEIDAKNNYLLVAPTKQDFYVKIIISENIKITKAQLQIGATVPAADENGELKISDFKVGNKVFIKAGENIAGKSEISDVISIQILP